jgi:hypothetical protein
MARRRRKKGPQHRAKSLPEETSETPPEVPAEPPLPSKSKSSKRLGPRWNIMSAVYGDSTAPDFPKITPD